MTFCALFLQVKIYVCVQKCEQPKPVYTKSRATFHLASWLIHSFIKIAAATSTSHRHCSQDLFIWRQARKRSQQHNGNQVAAATSEVATTANCSSSNMFIARHIVGNILRLSYFFLAKATITMARKPQQKKATNNYATLLLNEWMNELLFSVPLWQQQQQQQRQQKQQHQQLRLIVVGYWVYGVGYWAWGCECGWGCGCG